MPASSRPVATTTYPFCDTTYTNTSPSPPSSYPTTYTGSKAFVTAYTLCASATAYPSIEGPRGLKPACIISNAAEINQNAFWDVYECCPGHVYYRRQCWVTWQQVGECLQKRVKEVVCMPQYIERAKNSTATRESKSSSAAGTVAATRPGGATSGSQSATAAQSTGAASSLDATHTSTSRAGAFIFLLLAVSSAAGILL